MKLNDIINRQTPPIPWSEGEKIPWNDPDFSERMLREHLSQDHDMASRRQTMIDLHVAWINETCLSGRPSRILDLGCGPGFYAQRLAQLGHSCVGIDFSPASIAYAKTQAEHADQQIDYVCGDIRKVDYGEGFDLVMLIYGEFNVFSKDDARRLLQRIHQALRPGGFVLLEPQTSDAIQEGGKRPSSWLSFEKGLFSESSHILLEEHFWHEDSQSATTRFFVLDTGSGDVEAYALTNEAYTAIKLDQLLIDMGFSRIKRLPSLAGSEEYRQEGLFVVMGRKE